MKKFLSGFLACGAIRSLEQDLVGKENYLKIVDAAWSPASITVPFAILLLIVATLLYTMDGNEKS